MDGSQSAFVNNRLIIDNIIMAVEAFHWLKLVKGSPKSEAFALKLDMSKAYDKFEW